MAKRRDNKFTPHQSAPQTASPEGEAIFYSLRPTVGEGLALPALKKLPAQRRLLMPPSDEGGGKTAGFDGGREN